MKQNTFTSTLRLLCIACLMLSTIPAFAGPRKDILRSTLGNGLRVVIVRNTLAPVVTTEINYLVGGNDTPAGFPGTAHALEHMMFRGSRGLSKDQLSAIAAAMGGNFNADTRQTITQYYFTVPSTDLDIALHIGALRMRSLDVAPGEWQKERGAIEQEVERDLSSPFYKFEVELRTAMFKGTPYAHDPLGTRDSFDKTSAHLLKSFYNTWYAPNNAILVIVGDVDPDATLHKVKALFGSIQAKKIPDHPSIKLQPVKPETLHFPTDYPVGIAAITYRFPGYDDKDYAASVILNDVLDSRRGKLFELVPEGKALQTSFGSDTLPKASIAYAIGVYPKGGNAKILLEAMHAKLAEVVKHGVSANMVKDAIRHEINRVEFRKNSISGVANEWSDALAIHGLNSPDALLDKFRKVSVADVNRLAARLLDNRHSIVAILTPETSGKPIVGKGYGGFESFGGGHPGNVKLPAWAEKSLNRLQIPRYTLAPVDYTLANGIRLIVQPESVSDTVSVYGSILNNPKLQQPAGKSGAATILNQLFQFGTKSLDRIAFNKALDDIGARENGGTDFSVLVPAAQFDRAVALLADNELHPALPERVFNILRTQTARRIAGEMQSPGYLAQRALTKGLVPAGDPALRRATPQSVMKLSLADIKKYYTNVFRPDMTTIVVVGKITPQHAKAVIERHFGKWKATGEKPVVDFKPVALNKASRAVIPDRSRIQNEVTLAENIQLTVHDRERFALYLGNTILSGGFYASRLFRDLREKTGLVYTVGSGFDMKRVRSNFSVNFGCDPAKTNKAYKLIIRDLREMQTAPVTDEELQRAKALMIRQIPLGAASTADIASRLLIYAQDDLPLDDPLIMARAYMKLTAKDIQAAFKKWVRPDQFVEVIQGPASD